MMYPKEIVYYGKKEPLPQQIPLQAGPLHLIYESGSLRYIKLGQAEILRMMYVALRDGNWRTYTAYISNEKIAQQEESFHITYDCHYQYMAGEKLFAWKAVISGDKTGRIHFRMDGKALTDFERNRLGFCVLHPIQECAGKTCKITHPDGKTTSGIFPKYISPHQPFKNIAAMQWAISDHVHTKINFWGDIFETEDQRNWTDASYKTYCTPLEEPSPVLVKKGTTISQSVEVSVSGKLTKAAIHTSPQPLTITIDHSKPILLPGIGIGANSRNGKLSATEAGLLAQIHFTHYRVKLPLYEAQWKTRFKQATASAAQLGLPLALTLVFGANRQEELNAFIEETRNKRAAIQSITLLQKDAAATPESLLDAVIAPLRENFSDVKIGAGTGNFFAELNRNRIASTQIDFLTYPANPQVHAFDNLSLIENMEGPFYTVESAKEFSNDTAVHVSSISLNMPVNPDDITEKAVYNPPVMPAQIDPRQMSLFGAGWTLGSIKNMAEAGAASLTYYQTKGMEGIIQGDVPSPLPEQFPATAGIVFPAYYIFTYILEIREAAVIPTISSAPLQFSSLLVASDVKHRLLLANHTGEELELTLPALSKQAVVKMLDETTAVEAMHQPHLFLKRNFEEIEVRNGKVQVRIKPFGIAIIDFE